MLEIVVLHPYFKTDYSLFGWISNMLVLVNKQEMIKGNGK